MLHFHIKKNYNIAKYPKKYNKYLLCPDSKQRIPTSSAQCHTIGGDTQARDSVVVSSKSVNLLSFESVPCIAVEVIITSKQISSTERESNTGDTTDDALVGVLHEFSVGSDIEETASDVIGTSSEGHSVGEELNGIDVRVVSSKCLSTFTGSDIPKFGCGITSSGNKNVLVDWVDGNTHNVSIVVREFSDF